MTFTIHNGNCIDVMRSMPDNSVDSIVTDPPYELGFMGKSWDSSGIAFNVEVWTEALRVLKPGGHLLAFSGSRTYHRMAVAIEDAGFQIRDQIMWIYGSGFPKSHDVSKAIDKAAGVEREVVGTRTAPDIRGGNLNATVTNPTYEINITAPSTPEAQQWAGWGTALKPAHEPIVLARKPLIGTVAANVLEFGTGGLNIDGSRVEGNPVPINKLVNWSGFGQEIRPDYEQTMNTQGRFPANLIHDGSDEVLAGFPDTKGGTWNTTQGARHFNNDGEPTGFQTNRQDSSVGSAARFFYCAKASKRDRNEGLDGFEAIRVHDGREAGNKGGSNPRNRTNDLKVNHHPTVKPTDLMRYLVKLITPPNGIVLDPFTGSGSTGKGAVIEGFNFIGIELDPDYVAIATARIQHQLDNIKPTLVTQEATS
jgi:site-specific DNA-methyltransferase (adenine-specific)